MKIGIITYYWSKNIGALLQAYSLKRFIKEQNKNLEVTFNNYQPKKLIKREHQSQLKTLNPIKYIKALSKNKNLSTWKSTFAKFPSPDTTSAKFNDDLYFYGSDEIWNYQNSIFKLDLHFFGEGHNKIKIAYAASIGNLNINLINNIPDQIKINIKKFEKISVRDNNTNTFVEKITGKKSKLVCDPTLLVDFFSNKEKLLNFTHEKKYILVYGRYFSKNEINKIKDFSNKNNLNVLSVSYYNLWADKNILSVNPNEFIYLVQGAELIFTSMFHGVILSFKYKKNFWFSKDPYRENKLSYFLNKFNLFFRSIENFSKQEMNYTVYDSELKNWIEESKEFIIDSIK